LLDIQLSDLLSHHWGYVAAVISAILFGVSSTFNKITLENVNPTVVAGTIYFVAGVFLFIFHLTPLCNKLLAKMDTLETETAITHKDYRTLVFVILCGSIIAPLLLLNGLNQTTAINSSLLLNAEALFTISIAYVFLNERCAKKEYLGIVMLLVGVIFVTTNGAFQSLTLTENLLGNLLIIGACFFWGIDNNLSKHLSKKRDIVLVTGLKCFIGGSTLLALSFWLGFSFSIPISAIPYILFVGAFSIAFSILFFLFALRKIGSMRTGVVFSTSSLFGAVLAFFVLREALTIVQIVAGAVMVLGIYVLYRCGRTKPNPL
jgi:drug/metabolite transporter (DMT)-like permease